MLLLILGFLAPLLSAAVVGAAPTIRLGVADTMHKLRREPANPSARQIVWDAPVRVGLARGEYRSAQLVVAAPSGRTRRDVRVSVGQLTRRPGGRVWPAADVRLWRVGYVELFNYYIPTSGVDTRSVFWWQPSSPWRGHWPEADRRGDSPLAETARYGGGTMPMNERRVWITFGAGLSLGGLLTVASAAGQLKPERVAVISSSGVNNDFRSLGEYDGRLQQLGWRFEKFRNTELPQFFERARDYDFVLTTSLWNYGDPQDLRPFLPRWQQYLDGGGIVVLTDMAYTPMCNWLSAWDAGLSIEYGNASEDLGAERAGLAVSTPSRFLTTPHPVGALNYWAHFRRWGSRYQVWAKTKGGTAIGVGAVIGRGVLLVTTGWSFSPAMLQNLYANAIMLKSGVWLTWRQAPDEMSPANFSARLVVENLRGEPNIVELQPQLRRRNGQVLLVGEGQRMALPPKARRTIAVTLLCRVRGDLEAVVAYRTGDMAETFEVAHPFRVPPLVEVRLKRTVFTRSDTVEIAVRTTPPKGRTARCLVTIRSDADSIFQRRLNKSETISLPAHKLSPGRYQVRVESVGEEKNGERAVTTTSFEVSSMDRPPLAVHIGRNGELLINGKPVFPLGTYHVGTDDLKAIKALGFNCVTGPIYDGTQTQLTGGQEAWHDEAHRQGLWVITELSEYIRSGRRNFEGARKLVSQLRVHPATVAHYAIDEPMGGGIGRELVEQFCRVVREADPDHPTFVNEVPGVVVTYADIADIAGTDPYPIGSDVPESLAGVGGSIQQAVEAAKGRPVWGIIQSHRQPPPNSQNRFPTPDAVRCMVYLALNHGAKGLLFYAWDDAYQTPQGLWVSGFKYSDELQTFFRQFNGEWARIGLHYALGQIRREAIRIEPPDAPLDAVWLVHGNVRMAIIVNPTSHSVRANLTTPAGRVDKELAAFEVYIVR